LRDDLSMRKVNFKWAPRALHRSQKAARVQVSRDVLDVLDSRTDRSLSNVCTGDDTCVYLNNPRTSMSIGADVTRPIQVRRTVTSKKGMFWIDFSGTGISAVVMLPAGQSFNKGFFASTVLPSIVDDRALSCPK
jgi:hypothetical protein